MQVPISNAGPLTSSYVEASLTPFDKTTIFQCRLRRPTFIYVGTALKHQGEAQDNLSGEGWVHTTDPTPTEDLVDHVQDVDPL